MVRNSDGQCLDLALEGISDTDYRLVMTAESAIECYIVGQSKCHESLQKRCAVGVVSNSV